MALLFFSRRIIAGTRSEIHSRIQNGYKKYYASGSETDHLDKDQVQNDEIKLVAAHVGSGYCRAALVSIKGELVKLAAMPYKVFHQGVFSEASSESIWNTLVKCIEKVTDQENLDKIRGIGFIAIPALVCLDANRNPLTASASRDPNINVIFHYDTRSSLEADKVNATHHALLKYFGERVLHGLEESKLMWLKNNLKEDCWDQVGHFFELTDFLTWKATGSFVRSSGTLIAQWTYEIAVNGNEGWNAQFMEKIGIPEMAEDNFRKIGSVVQRPGTPIADGLLEKVAKEMGLPEKLPVASGIPDGLAGCLGLIGCKVENIADDITNRMCIVFGTRAASHFVLSRDPYFVKGVNGPFRDSVFPNMWLNHAGQTTAESALEYIITAHPATPEMTKQIGHMSVYTYLNKILKIKAQKKKLSATSFLTKDIHVIPDFDGNKSPLSDPSIRGMISGLSLTTSLESLAYLYLATIQSLAYSTRHIMSGLAQQGHEIKCILIGGDLGQNSLFANLQKDVCQMPIVSPQEPRSKLIGAAILAAVASKTFPDFRHASREMCGMGQVVLPTTNADEISYHERKYQVFLKMYDHQLQYRKIMSGGLENSNCKI
ncbi:FGGY carbohydrate kinase domain-containing protein isoform X1 [Dendroctonus ponderosae]|uniref:FGGY carbohydrate kinase domain-containing protein isoform X1 n=1 Tax=Dendroctonus ponderosae TaxID=77166 RepID=UPI0020364F6B|nr:FGGY carbohydrate kinase domain-containing protein isoform X1 [Dendroctonus ponderosae]KAH1015300.1 hypothetical protein HUJ05_013054 [Dendroctonus ponderosae]